MVQTTIGSIPEDCFSKLTKRKSLFLYDNGIGSLEPGIFNGLHSLRELNLGTNSIDTIPVGVLSQLKLKKLYLYENDLSEIRKEYWEGLDSLMVLKINDNGIQDIHPDALSNLINLDLLHLHNNNLKTLKSNLFGDSHPVELEVSLIGNPLRCDEDLCWLIQAESDGWLTWTQGHAPRCGIRRFIEVEMGCQNLGMLT